MLHLGWTASEILLLFELAAAGPLMQRDTPLDCAPSLWPYWEEAQPSHQSARFHSQATSSKCTSVSPLVHLASINVQPGPAHHSWLCPVWWVLPWGRKSSLGPLTWPGSSTSSPSPICNTSQACWCHRAADAASCPMTVPVSEAEATPLQSLASQLLTPILICTPVSSVSAPRFKATSQHPLEDTSMSLIYFWPVRFTVGIFFTIWSSVRLPHLHFLNICADWLQNISLCFNALFWI